LYKTLVRPLLEFNVCVWYPVKRGPINNLEKIQHRATKLIPGLQYLSYKERLVSLKLPSLQYRRRRGDMIQVYNYIHGNYKVNNIEVLLPRDHRALNLRGHSLKLLKLRPRKTVRKKKFSNRVVNDWNSLTEEIVTSDNVNLFKSRLDRHWSDIMYDC